MTADWVNPGEVAFAAWAPERGPWSEWAKPAMFATMAVSAEAAPPIAPKPITVEPRSAVVVDLPGPEAVAVGIALNSDTFQVVPLFNGTPGPNPAIDLEPLMRAMMAAVPTLRARPLAPAALPAFLLDSQRLETLKPHGPGLYDNRWMTLPQDFPSASLLIGRGVERVLLVQTVPTIQPDLSHVVRRWHEQGLVIDVLDMTTGNRERGITVPKPSRYRRLWYVGLALMGFRMNSAGGFGSVIPEPGSGSG